MKCMHEMNNRVRSNVSLLDKKNIKSHVLKELQLDESGLEHDNCQKNHHNILQKRLVFKYISKKGMKLLQLWPMFKLCTHMT